MEVGKQGLGLGGMLGGRLYGKDGQESRIDIPRGRKYCFLE
jgi:hypothetical protein